MCYEVCYSNESKNPKQSIKIDVPYYDAEDTQIREIAESVGQIEVSQDFSLLYQCLEMAYKGLLTTKVVSMSSI
jgi:hypothetical protein